MYAKNLQIKAPLTNVRTLKWFLSTALKNRGFYFLDSDYFQFLVIVSSGGYGEK